MNRSVIHKNTCSNWETPPEFFELIQQRFQLEIDVCASARNAKLPIYFTEEDDALSKPWAPQRCWMNPPYGRGNEWVEKAAREAAAGALVVALLPNNTDTRWFHDWVLPYARIEFVKGRVQFLDFDGERTTGNPTGSILAIYGSSL